MEIEVAAACARRIADNMEKVIVGKRQVIELMLAALLAEGHVLLEDVPGTGKTHAFPFIGAVIGHDI